MEDHNYCQNLIFLHFIHNSINTLIYIVEKSYKHKTDLLWVSTFGVSGHVPSRRGYWSIWTPDVGHRVEGTERPNRFLGNSDIGRWISTSCFCEHSIILWHVGCWSTWSPAGGQGYKRIPSTVSTVCKGTP